MAAYHEEKLEKKPKATDVPEPEVAAEDENAKTKAFRGMVDVELERRGVALVAVEANKRLPLNHQPANDEEKTKLKALRQEAYQNAYEFLLQECYTDARKGDAEAAAFLKAVDAYKEKYDKPKVKITNVDGQRHQADAARLRDLEEAHYQRAQARKAALERGEDPATPQAITEPVAGGIAEDLALAAKLRERYRVTERSKPTAGKAKPDAVVAARETGGFSR